MRYYMSLFGSYKITPTRMRKGAKKDRGDDTY
jgi:hypothetical protein